MNEIAFRLIMYNASIFHTNAVNQV